MLAEDRNFPADVGRLFASIQAVEARVLPLIAEVIELRKAERREEAQQIVWRDTKPLFVERLDNMNALTDFKEQIFQGQLTLAIGVSGRFATVMLSLTVVALLVGVAAALLLSRTIRYSLGAEPWQVEAVADAVRAGDLTTDTSVHGSTESKASAYRA